MTIKIGGTEVINNNLRILNNEALPDIKPSLNLDFANTKALDPRITYTRGSTATYYDGKTFAKAEENLLIRSQEFDNAAWEKNSSSVTANSTTAPDGTTTADTITRSGTSFALVAQAITATAASYVASVFAKAGTQDFLAIQINTNGVTKASFITFDLTDGSVGTEQTLTSPVGLTASATDVGNGWYRCSVVYTSLGGSDIILLNASSAADSRNGTDGGTIYLWGAQLEQRSALTDYTATTTQPITNYVPALQTAASGEPRFDHDPITGESKGFLIEEQRTNLLTYSEQFDNAAWSKVASSITSNTIVAPDGTLTGDKLVEDATNSGKTIYANVTVADNSFITYSCYFKEAGRSRAGLEFYGAGGLNVAINLDAGTINVGTPYDSGTDASGTITPVGNGWYRVSLTLKTKSGDTSGVVQIRLLDDSNNAFYTGDGYSGIYIWGAQLEQASFPTSYIPTVASQVTRSPDAASMTGTNFSSWYRQDEGTVFVDANENFVGNNGGPWWLNNGTDFRGIAYRRSGDTNNLELIYRQPDATSRATVVSGAIPSGQYNKVISAFEASASSVSVNGSSATTSTSNNLYPFVDQLRIGYTKITGSSPHIWCGHIKKLAYYPKRLSNDTLQALTEE